MLFRSPVLLEVSRLVEVIFDASNVGTSCQTHSVAAGKHEVSMGSTVLEVHHRDVDVDLEGSKLVGR